MTTAAQTLDELSGRRSFTIADVAALTSQLPSGPVDYELIRGKLMMTSPTGDPHGKVQSRVVAAFVVQGDQRGLGTTRTETGVILGRNLDTLLGRHAHGGRRAARIPNEPCRVVRAVTTRIRGDASHVASRKPCGRLSPNMRPCSSPARVPPASTSSRRCAGESLRRSQSSTSRRVVASMSR